MDGQFWKVVWRVISINSFSEDQSWAAGEGVIQSCPSLTGEVILPTAPWSSDFCINSLHNMLLLIVRGSPHVFTHHFIKLTFEEARPELFRGVAQPRMNAAVRSQLIHPGYLWSCQHAEAGVSPWRPFEHSSASWAGTTHVDSCGFSNSCWSKSLVLFPTFGWVSLSYNQCMNKKGVI